MRRKAKTPSKLSARKRQTHNINSLSTNVGKQRLEEDGVGEGEAEFSRPVFQMRPEVPESLWLGLPWFAGPWEEDLKVKEKTVKSRQAWKAWKEYGAFS